MKEGPRVTAGLLSKEETVKVDDFRSTFQPRKEYLNGGIKLDFKHSLSGGKTFEATEDIAGRPSIVIKQGGRVMVDFAGFLPSNFIFATPTYLQNFYELTLKQRKDMIPGEWWEDADNGIISIGDMRRPSEIFTILHEIGHANQTSEWRKKMEKSLPHRNNTQRRKVGSWSARERDAWLGAIRIARQIKKESGVDLFEVFKTKEEFHEFLYSALSSFKQKARFNVARQGLKSRLEYVASLLFGLDTEDGKFVDGLFDKGRLRRGDSVGQKGQEGEATKA